MPMSLVRSLFRLAGSRAWNVVPFLLIAALASIAGCAASDAGAAARAGGSSVAPAPVPAAWRPLLQRLQADGLDGPDLVPLFVSLGETPSQDPMGRKIRELYTKEFAPKPKPAPAGKPAKPARPAKPLPPPVYPGVVTQANAQRCRDFLKANKASFDRAERTYGVPREIAVALLFVETRLGDFLGGEKAFRTLASMAASRDPAQIPDYLAKLPDADQRRDWIRQKMEQRSDWAYREFTALLANARAAGADPLAMPGSIYGAVGLCQFMPSNIARFGADGNGDGVVDLFTVPDAVASLSNYLKKNGWKSGLTRLQQHRVIKSYNRVNIYANTILALADATRAPASKPAAKPASKSSSTPTRR